MIFIKVISSIAIFCITTYIGIEMANNLKAREYILTDMITFLKMVQNEMVYMLNNLPVAYEMARQKLNSQLKDVIGAIVVDINNYGVSKVEMSITQNVDSLTELEPYDKEIIISTLKNLGRSDLDSQNNIIENSIAILKERIKEAKNVKIKNSKMYKTIGVISGLLIVIVFI